MIGAPVSPRPGYVITRGGPSALAVASPWLARLIGRGSLVKLGAAKRAGPSRRPPRSRTPRRLPRPTGWHGVRTFTARGLANPSQPRRTEPCKKMVGCGTLNPAGAGTIWRFAAWLRNCRRRADREEAHRSPQYRILVVDDNKDSAQSLALLLTPLPLPHFGRELLLRFARAGHGFGQKPSIFPFTTDLLSLRQHVAWLV
jgi:hypothetical protein